MGKTVNIGGRIHNPEVGNVVAGANEILDDTKGKKQNVINSEVDTALAGLDSGKQDKLNFDQTPTESSTNPVTSGGVYAADQVLQQAIEAILLLIPSAASALNQLADKSFVNSSIATASATFRGTYNLVSDLHLSVSASHQDIATALASVVATADNNDYCFVQVPTSDTSSDIRVTERYKFNGTDWQYEYDLNNSGFTAQQWAAINSTITSALVGKLTALPTADELAALLAGKQATLTFDSTPTPGSANPVTSGGLYDKFEAIIAKIPSDASANNKLVAENRLAAYVGAIVGALDATFDLTSTDGHVTLRITQTDGLISSVQVLTSDIASAQALTTLSGQVSTNASDIATLQDLYNALQQSAPEIIQPTDTWPVANPSDTVIYRVIDRVNTPPEYYSDYMWNGTTMVLMATYNNAIDPRPKKGSANLVTSGGVFDNIGALDISELNASGGTLASYATLDAAIAAIPSDYQKGGMSIKFVSSVDNKYVTYSLTKDEWSAAASDWVIVLTDKVIDAVNAEMNQGSFIRPDGTSAPNEDMFISDTISLSKGDILKVNVKASASTSVISKVVSENTYQSLVVGSDGYNVVEYTYTATENCTVVISGINSGGLSGTITHQGTIAQMQNEISDINESLDEATQNIGELEGIIEGGEYHKTITPEVYSSQYVDSDGTVQTSHSQSQYYDMTKPFDMKQGDVLTLSGAGGSFVAAISVYKGGAYIVKKTYTNVSATQEILTYIATEDCQVVCCYRKDNGTWTHSIIIDGIEPSVNEKIETVDTKVNNLSESVIKENVIEVGTGKDFTSLVTAIESINDSSYLNQYKILLYEGEYETVVEADIEEGYRGLIIPDYVSIIGMGNRDDIIIKGTLPSASYATYANTISTINLMMNGVVENVTIKSKNLRYCNHDDAGSIGMVDDAKHVFRYVRFVTDVMDSGIDTAGNCVGIGSQVNKEVVFENCVFETLDSANRSALVIHDNSSNSQKRGARISILNCLFKMTWYDIRVSNSGGDMLSFITLTGNRLSHGIRVEASGGVDHNIWKITATNNDQYRLDNSITGVDISEDVVAFNNIAIQ